MKSNMPEFLKQLEQFLDEYLRQKAPLHLPPNIKEFIVKYGPWISLVLLVLALPLVLAAMGMSLLFLPFATVANPLQTGAGAVHWAIAVVSFVLHIVALPGLFKRSLKGWYFAYSAALVSFIGGIIQGEILGAILGAIISLYILFQIRSYYK